MLFEYYVNYVINTYYLIICLKQFLYISNIETLFIDLFMMTFNYNYLKFVARTYLCWSLPDLPAVTMTYVTATLSLLITVYHLLHLPVDYQCIVNEAFHYIYIMISDINNK